MAKQHSGQHAATAQAVDAQEVACVAYELYECRGRADGYDREDWLKAEAIVRQRRVSAAVQPAAAARPQTRPTVAGIAHR